MDSEFFDLVARTRPTILEILKDRGFNVASLENQSVEELQKMAIKQIQLLNLKVEKTEGSDARHVRCHVVYVFESIRLKLEGFLNHFFDEDNENRLIPEEDEIIFILTEPVNEAFHLQVVKFWNRMKAHISFFHIKHLVSNPRHHILVPPHRRITEEEAIEIMKRLYIRSKSEFRRIIFHIDTQARIMGLIPGDLVEIKIGSPTCGELTEYRVCSL
jgi:DNA-directed RNA polymerase subunit H (RpoH/RPB5)